MNKSILKKIDTIFKKINNFINNEPKEYVFVLYSIFALLINRIEDEFTIEEITENREKYFKLLYEEIGTNDYAHLFFETIESGSDSRWVLEHIHLLNECYDEEKGFDKECLIENFLIEEIEK